MTHTMHSSPPLDFKVDVTNLNSFFLFFLVRMVSTHGRLREFLTGSKVIIQINEEMKFITPQDKIQEHWFTYRTSFLTNSIVTNSYS